ncbi:MAG: hypothetical protein IIW01_04485, partial [Thermoguttaceae bacterium]|nr:hypothetical protein [Thermoguttaceae bacterium]
VDAKSDASGGFGTLDDATPSFFAVFSFSPRTGAAAVSETESETKDSAERLSGGIISTRDGKRATD